MGMSKRLKKSKLKQVKKQVKTKAMEKRRVVLGALSIVFIVLTLVFTPVVRINMIGGLGILDEKPILEFGDAGVFTLGDVGFIISLISAACTITLFIKWKP